MQTSPSRIVVSDGFHITPPKVLTSTDHRTFYFNIVCAVDNDLLVGALIFMLMLFSMGATAGFLLLQVLSTLPICYILFLYYIKRRDFIQLRPA